MLFFLFLEESSYLCPAVHISNSAAKVGNNFQPSKENDENFHLMSNILERIQEISEKEGLTITAFERSIGASKGVLSRAINNGTDIQSKWIQTIVENYPQYSSRWLLTGRGEMLVQPTKENDENFSRSNEKPLDLPQITFEVGKGIPYFDVDFIGGFGEIFNYQTVVPACNVVVPGFEKASVWCNVTGHSMEPKINHGDIIALRECSINDVQYGEIYAVVLDTIRTIKILRRGSTPDVLLYVPINQDFDEQEFPTSRIIRVFEVLGSIARFF